MGTLDSYWQANMDLLDPESGFNLSSLRTRTNMDYESLHAMPPSWVSVDADLDRSVVSPGCRLEGRVSRSVLSPGVVVEPGAVVEDSVIMHRTVIRAGAKVIRAVVGKNVKIAANARLGANVIVHPEANIPAEDIPHGATVTA